MSAALAAASVAAALGAVSVAAALGAVSVAAALGALAAVAFWEPSSSSRSHSASGSSVPIWAPAGLSSPEAAPARAIRPSATASATTLVSSATLRIASSLPGIG